MRTFWDELAERCLLSRAYLKRCVYLLGYGGSVDPWLDHIVVTEMDALIKERGWKR